MQAWLRSIMGQIARVGTIRTDIPARMDRLPWSRWHWLVVIALGITWSLNGLEVTLVGAIAPRLTDVHTLGLTSTQVGLAASIYVAGAVTGALFFGYLTDRLGRKRLFVVCLGVYVAGTLLTALSWTFWSFALFRFIAGTGIGGEYSAINSAIDELIPARLRGRVDLAINSSFWIGTAVAASVTLLILNPSVLPLNVGWRVGFAIGAIVGIGILLVRRHVPESPRWLLTHGFVNQANAVVGSIELQVRQSRGLRQLPRPSGATITVRPRGFIGFDVIAYVMLRVYPGRSILGLSLMIGQAFFYSAILFTYGLVLTTFYGVPTASVGLYLIPLSAGNVLGPWILGPLFDTVGRKPMISFTYIVSGVMLGITGWLFSVGVLDATTQTIAWSVIFFFASAGASAAYLTVSEIFPLELRAMAIAIFFAIGAAAGGIAGPVLFGSLIQTGRPVDLFYGYLIGAGLMAAAGMVEIILGVNAERRSLESIAAPISAVEERRQRPPRREKPKRRAA